MKKLLTFLFLFCFFIHTIKAETWKDSYGITWTFEVTPSNQAIGIYPTNKSTISGDIVIPEKVFIGDTELTVSSIGSYAFYKCSDLTSVTIPEGVTSIGSYAFYGCDLTSVTIPEGMTSIGELAFSSTSLMSVTIPSSITSISSAFYFCPDLTSVTINSNAIMSETYSSSSSLKKYFGNKVKEYIIGEEVKSIGGYTFYGCSSLTSVIIPEGVTSIGSYAFGDCTGLTSVNIPEGVTSIGERAFRGCSGLTRATIGEGVTSIGERAFDGCSGLTKVIAPNITAWCGISFGDYAANPLYYAEHLYSDENTEITNLIIPSSVTSIGAYAFEDCSSLTSVTIPEGVTSIGGYAFSGCSGLTSVTIPEGVTSIGNQAFRYCSGLTAVTIPSSVTNIGNYAFGDCTGLTSVTINSDAIMSKTYTSSSSLKNYFGNQVKEFIIGEEVKSIGRYAFSGCSGMTSLTISKGVINIGSLAFLDCTGLTKVIVPDITAWCGISFDDHAANPLPYAGHIYSDNNTEIINLVIPKGITNIGNYTFLGLDNLMSVTISEDVISIGDESFAYCKALTSITIPKNVASISSNSFYNCSNLANVTIASDAILSKSYTSNSSLKDIFGNQVRNYFIGDDVASIGNYAFSNCSDMTSVTIPEGVTSIGYDAFYNCSSLTAVTIPSSVTNIGIYAFYNCTGLKSVTIGEGVTSIGNYAFSKSEACKIYVNRGTKTLLSLWDDGYTNVYYIGTDVNAIKPVLSLISATQTTLKVKIDNYAEEFKYEYDDGIVGKEPFMITGLCPDVEEKVTVSISSDDKKIDINSTFMPQSLSLQIEASDITATSFSVSGSYSKGDALVTTESLKVYNDEVEGSYHRLTGLNPGTSYTIVYAVKVVASGKDGEKTYDCKTTQKVRTSNIILKAQTPKVVSEGNVIVAAETNVDNTEENLGFEWRRTDWTDDFPSNTGIAYLYEGTMEGYIRNLNTDKLWKFRPYYLSDSGTYYYGDWMGLDPTNTSYFEPTVHTYAKIEVEGNTALVKGYALNGTDKIAVQGFKYWKSSNKANGMSMAPAKAPAIPGSAQTVEAEGRVMEATLSGLDYETDYSYVAFVKTTEGETFYGDVRSFTTGVNTSVSTPPPPPTQALRSWASTTCRATARTRCAQASTSYATPTAPPRK